MIKYQVEKFVECKQETDTIVYEVVASKTDLVQALKTFSNFVQNNPSYAYRLVEVVVDEVRSSEPTD